MIKSIKNIFIALYLSLSFMSTQLLYSQISLYVPLYGDANNDGILNESDIQIISNYILGKSEITGNGDANQDGIINVADITWIANYINTFESISILLPGDIPIKFIKINGGSFQMGSDDLGWSSSWEKPVHNVNIEYNFYMSKYEITRAQWGVVIIKGFTPTISDYIYPAENISWNNAQDFVKKLNLLGLGTFRLPSESEWEYACRANSTTRYYFGTSDCVQHNCEGCDLDDYCWWCGNNFTSGAKPIGHKKPNAFGLYDMYGNVQELCQDDWHDNYNNAPTDGSAWIIPDNITKVARGGHSDSDGIQLRSSTRQKIFKDSTDESTGIRLILIK